MADLTQMKGKHETVPSSSPCRLDGRNCDSTLHPGNCLVRNPTSGADMPDDHNDSEAPLPDDDYLIYSLDNNYVISRFYYQHVRRAYDLILNCGFIDNDLDAALKHLGTILNGEPYHDSSTADRPSDQHPGERPSEHRDSNLD